MDKIVKEPLGGAHRDYAASASYLADALGHYFEELSTIDPQLLVEERRNRIREFGFYST